MFDNKYCMFRMLISGLDEATQATLSYMYSKERGHEEYRKRQEREKLKKEIVNEVLSLIKLNIDVSNVTEQIEELDKYIRKLGQ